MIEFLLLLDSVQCEYISDDDDECYLNTDVSKTIRVLKITVYSSGYCMRNDK